MFGFLRRPPRIAPARALKLGAHRAPPARKVSTIVSLGVRVSTVNAQLSWLMVAATALGATYFVSKIEIKPPPPIAVAVASPKLVVPSFRVLDLDALTRDIVVFDPHARPHAQDVYGPEALGAIGIPGAALVVALLCSWQRRKRRLLRYGLAAQAEIRAFDTTGETSRGSTVELRLPVEGTKLHKGIVTVRPPDAIGDTEAVLYDPHQPAYAFAVADLPGRPRVVDNRLVPTSFPWFTFLAPLAGLGMLGLLAGTVVRLFV